MEPKQDVTDNETVSVTSLLSLIRQYMELNTEFLSTIALHTKYDHELPENYITKLKSLEEIAKRFPVGDAIELNFQYKCSKCQKEFDTPNRCNFGDHHKADISPCCPHCGHWEYFPIIPAL